uniref:Uncharacterized protein n=1 Tax=Anguilla anguilla TaxID=7936 RepID=A0A0E9PBK2_ANGAN
MESASSAKNRGSFKPRNNRAKERQSTSNAAKARTALCQAPAEGEKPIANRDLATRILIAIISLSIPIRTQYPA